MKWTALAFFALTATAFSRPPSARQLIIHAEHLAAKAHKNVLVDFRASWCPWCRHFDKLIETPPYKADFEKSYIYAPIVIRERDELRKLENRGWQGAMRRLRHSRKMDIPYLVILSPEGKELGDSLEPKKGAIPDNAGFPRTKKEVEAFLALLHRTGSGFPPQDLESMREVFAKTDKLEIVREKAKKEKARKAKEAKARAAAVRHKKRAHTG